MSENEIEDDGYVTVHPRLPAELDTFPSGMKRSSDAGKVRHDFVHDGPMLDRWAQLLTNPLGDNWTLANSVEEMKRFRASAARHFRAWMRGDQDEDHAAAVFFNINGYEHVRNKLGEQRAAEQMQQWLEMFERVEAELENEPDDLFVYPREVVQRAIYRPGDPLVEGAYYVLEDGAVVKLVRGNGAKDREGGVPDIVNNPNVWISEVDNLPSKASEWLLFPNQGNWGLSTEGFYVVRVSK